ncbi:class I SAM-dependent methyltransferase [Mangrovimonas cancribranchiae]|uniref:Class I SAM-dependent methyltransferase n=1 Tax=Mangrovimonas cancribranchiae TaxID=3080055 RepID=A0AAU6P137_9FLAO
MKKRDILNPIALLISKRKLSKSFKLNDFDSIYDFSQSYIGRGYYDRISLHQFKDEFRSFVNYVKKTEPKIVVEIGTKKGGSFFMWARYLKPNHLISIDLPGGIHGGGFPKQKIPFMKYFLSDKKNSKVSVVLGDSHKKETYNQLVNKLNGRQIDFLFIDGDHRYEGVKSDYEMYSGLVKKGGLIAFHDIVESDYHHNLNCYVDKFWNEIKNKHEYVEFIESPKQRKYGIGVLIK